MEINFPLSLSHIKPHVFLVYVIGCDKVLVTEVSRILGSNSIASYLPHGTYQGLNLTGSKILILLGEGVGTC